VLTVAQLPAAALPGDRVRSSGAEAHPPPPAPSTTVPYQLGSAPSRSVKEAVWEARERRRAAAYAAAHAQGQRLAPAGGSGGPASNTGDAHRDDGRRPPHTSTSMVVGAGAAASGSLQGLSAGQGVGHLPSHQMMLDVMQAASAAAASSSPLSYKAWPSISLLLLLLSDFEAKGFGELLARCRYTHVCRARRLAECRHPPQAAWGLS
jgi:hypothetical protein